MDKKSTSSSLRCGVLITCEDKRLHQRPDGRNLVGDFIKNFGYDCDLVTRGGGIHDLVSPEQTGSNFDNSVLRDIKIGVHMHGAATIIIVGHENCGAYLYLGKMSPEQEIMRIENDLRKARNILKRKFPQVEVILYMAYLHPGTDGNFHIKEIS